MHFSFSPAQYILPLCLGQTGILTQLFNSASAQRVEAGSIWQRYLHSHFVHVDGLEYVLIAVITYRCLYS